MKHLRLTMKMIYQNPTINNIMTDLNDFSVPWKNTIENGVLDFGYYQHSANKRIAPFVFEMVQDYSVFPPIQALTNEQRTKIAGMVYELLHRKWDRLWDVLNAEYNPISNYDMTENETISNVNANTIENTGTNTNASTSNGSDTTLDTGTITHVIDKDTSQTGTVSNTGTTNTDDNIFGFNSNSAVPSDTREERGNNVRTDNLNGTDDTTDTETLNTSRAITSRDSATNTETLDTTTTSNGTNDTTRRLTRSGNIGVTTSQQMLQSDIELWQWDYFKMVFEDIDSILCLQTY